VHIEPGNNIVGIAVVIFYFRLYQYARPQEENDTQSGREKLTPHS
jgi:hypothetical protein